MIHGMCLADSLEGGVVVDCPCKVSKLLILGLLAGL
jgi:hypothetical protein